LSNQLTPENRGVNQDSPGRSGDAAAQKQLDTESPTEDKAKDMLKLIDEIKLAMLTTVRSDGSLVSRVMYTRAHHQGSLWFFSNNESCKMNELEHNNNVNVAYVNQSTGEWVSVSGKAKIVTERAKVRELYNSDIKAWFGDLNDGIHDGSAEDPRVVLIVVDPTSIHWQKKDVTAVGGYLRVLMSMVTGEIPQTHTKREINEDEVNKLKDLKLEE
jgi:general stress protein 26